MALFKEDFSLPNKGWLWHIATGGVTLLFLSGIYWGKVSAYDGRIATVEMAQTRDSITIAAMKQEVDDLHDWMKSIQRGNYNNGR